MVTIVTIFTTVFPIMATRTRVSLQEEEYKCYKTVQFDQFEFHFYLASSNNYSTSSDDLEREL